MDQVAIAVLGAFAAWLSQARQESSRRWACIFGIVGQPFWFYAAWKAQQWGIFVVCVLYVLAWMKGLWTYWLAPSRKQPSALEPLMTLELPPGAKK